MDEMGGWVYLCMAERMKGIDGCMVELRKDGWMGR